MGYLFEVILSEVPLAVFYIDLADILVSLIVVFLFALRRIRLSHVFIVQILVLMANMVFSHYTNPVDSSNFTALFLRNSLTLGMLVPIYGLFCGKRYIFQIAVVYIFLYVSTLLRIHNQFLIENAPFLLLNSTIYFLAIFYILHILEKTSLKQKELNNDLLQQKAQLIARNEDLEQKNRLIHQQSGELRDLNITKDKLFSVIAHDLRSPFNSILGFSDLLIEDIENNDIKNSIRNVSIINSTAKHTLALLENLLDWTRIQTGQIVFKPKNLYLEPIVTGILSLMESSLTLKEIRLNISLGHELSVFADPNMLQAILRNLIQNAIKFTGNRGTIGISAITRDGQIEITVSDNGIGMNEKVLSSLFETNTGISTPGTANEKGSGLGLILCKEFVKVQGGIIWAESQPGKGSSFIFTLPLKS